MTNMIFFVTVPNLEEAKRIANILINNYLAACVNIIQNLISIYRWKGKIEEDNELLLLIKTSEEKSDLLLETIKNIHTYENPECIGFKIEKGLENYLNWIKESLI